MNEGLPKKQFSLKALKRWKLVQIVAILPLALTVALMIFFRGAGEFHIVAFFLVLIIGILMPQVSSDLILSHFFLREELGEQISLLQGEVQSLRSEIQANKPEKGDPTVQIVK